MRAREWLYEAKDPKVAAMQRAMRKAGALNVNGPQTGKPLTIDGIEGPNTRYNMDRPEFSAIVRQYKNPSAPRARNQVAPADSLAPGEELEPQRAADRDAISHIQTGIDAHAAQVAAAQVAAAGNGSAARPAMPHTPTPAHAIEPDVAVPTSIDPIVRKRMGLPPATTAEIDAYAKVHPAVVGNAVDREGKPIISGAAAEIEKDARKAAKDLEAKQGKVKDLETKQGPNPKIDNDSRDAAMTRSNEAGGSFDITFGDRFDEKTKTIKNGRYKTVAQWSKETLGTPLELTDLTLEQVKEFQAYKNSLGKNSGAVGAYQFMPTTLFGRWREDKNGKRYFADGLVQQLKIPMTAKFDQQLQQRFYNKFSAGNDAILKKNGVEVNSANRYMSHYVGPSGAVIVHKEREINPNMTVAQAMVKNNKEDPTANNPELAILTVGNFPEIMAKRMDGHIGYGRPTPQQFAALANRNRVA